MNDTYLSVIYQCLGHPNLRTTASETLANIVSKKMSAADKLQLITFLNLTQVVNSVEADDDAEFSEGMAKLVNAQGIELTRILTEAPIPSRIYLRILINFQSHATSEIAAKSQHILRALFPLLLRYLSDDYDDTSVAVFPFLTDLLSLVQKLSNIEITLSVSSMCQNGCRSFRPKISTSIATSDFQKDAV